VNTSPGAAAEGSGRAVAAAAALAPLLLLALTMEPGVLTGARLLGAGTADLWGHIWGYSWVEQSISGGRLPFRDAPLAWPDGQDWWVIDLSVALLLLPVTALLGAEAAWTLALLAPIAVGAGALCAWLLRRAVPPTHAVVAGVLAATSPFVRGAVVSGVPEALVVLVAPLLALWMRAGLAGRWIWCLAAGVLGAVMVLDGAYGAIIGGLVGLAVTIGALWSGERRSVVLRRALAITALPAVAVGVVAAALRASAHPALSSPALILSESVDISGRDWLRETVTGADLLSFVTPAALLPATGPASRHAHIVYVGLACGIAAIAAAWRRPSARGPALLAAVAALLSLGPILQVAGRPVLSPLPGAALHAIGATNLYRLAGLVPGALLAAVAIGLARSPPRRAALLWFVIALDWGLAPSIPLRLPTVVDPAGAVEAWIAARPEPGAVLDLPTDREGTAARGPWPQRNFYLQTHHGRPIASALYATAPILRSDPQLSRFAQVIRRSRLRAQPLTAHRVREPRPPRLVPPRSRVAQKLVRALLDAGFAFVTLDLELIPPRQREPVKRWAGAWLGAPQVREGLRSAWLIPEDGISPLRPRASEGADPRTDTDRSTRGAPPPRSPGSTARRRQPEPPPR